MGRRGRIGERRKVKMRRREKSQMTRLKRKGGGHHKEEGGKGRIKVKRREGVEQKKADEG